MQLVYFASPMCSWCWGFSTVMQELEANYGKEKIRLVLTPFRVDTTEPMDDELRSYVLGQWHKVHETTGQVFNFRFAMPDDFIYNTTLVCLSIKAFTKQLAVQELEYMRVLQQAYYNENCDLTSEAVLLRITQKFDIDIELFKQDLFSEKVKLQLNKDFDLCRKLQVQSYPTLMLHQSDNYYIVAKGYASFEIVNQSIESLLAKVNSLTG